MRKALASRNLVLLHIVRVLVIFQRVILILLILKRHRVELRFCYRAELREDFTDRKHQGASNRRLGTVKMDVDEDIPISDISKLAGKMLIGQFSENP
jgi:hypothetical protein